MAFSTWHLMQVLFCPNLKYFSYSVLVFSLHCSTCFSTLTAYRNYLGTLWKTKQH
jgi:hypothetical protein